VIRASELGGKAVVDVDAAEKLGKVDRVVLDPDARRIAGFVVTKGSSLLGTGEHLTLPASSVHAIGKDAVTVHHRRPGAGTPAGADLEHLPRVSDLVGRKVVSDQGRLLGAVDDVLIDENDGRIIGYALTGTDIDDKLKHLLPKRGEDRREPYLRADAHLRAGKDLIVAPEDAVSHDWDAAEAPRPVSSADEPRRWGASALPLTVASTEPSSWVRTEADWSIPDPEDREH
jgi:sporulation protein YlmC with PRC-barrel domain